MGFACVILNQPLLCAAVFALALIAERDPWTGRQTLQAFALSAATAILRKVLTFVIHLFPGDYYSWGVLRYFSVALGALSALVYLLAIVVSVLAITRVMKDREADLPLLSDLAYWAFGLRKPRPVRGTISASPLPAVPACPPRPISRACEAASLSALYPTKSPCAAPAWDHSPDRRTTQGVKAPFSS